MITCTVTLLNETIYATGFYTITFSNSLGNMLFAFEVKEKLQTTTNAVKITDSPGPFPGAIIGGVIGGIVFIVLIVVIIIFIIRRKGRQLERGSQTTLGMTSKTDPQKSLETLYDHLHRGDINSPSVYQTLGSQQTSCDFTDHEDQGKSHVYEVPIGLHENTRETHQKETVYQNSTFS